MSTRRKGNDANGWVADWLHPWFPDACPVPNGRPGRDIENAPGLAIEVKTAAEWRPIQWRKQSERYALPGELPLLVYFPPKFGKGAVGDTLTIVRTRLIMPVLVAAEYAPLPRTAEGMAGAEARWSAIEGAGD